MRRGDTRPHAPACSYTRAAARQRGSAHRSTSALQPGSQRTICVSKVCTCWAGGSAARQRTAQRDGTDVRDPRRCQARHAQRRTAPPCCRARPLSVCARTAHARARTLAGCRLAATPPLTATRTRGMAGAQQLRLPSIIDDQGKGPCFARAECCELERWRRPRGTRPLAGEACARCACVGVCAGACLCQPRCAASDMCTQQTTSGRRQQVCLHPLQHKTHGTHWHPEGSAPATAANTARPHGSMPRVQGGCMCMHPQSVRHMRACMNIPSVPACCPHGACTAARTCGCYALPCCLSSKASIACEKRNTHLALLLVPPFSCAAAGAGADAGRGAACVRRLRQIFRVFNAVR